jgi:uncharacterized protein involved in cysteine biosynthesis
LRQSRISGLTCGLALSIQAGVMDILTALARGFGQLTDPAVLRVLAKSLAVTIVIFIGLGIGVYLALVEAFAYFGLSDGGLASATAATLIALVSFWFLFRVIALAVLQFFADEIVKAVELKHFPESAATVRALPFREDLHNSMRGMGRTIGLNLLALPIAVLLLFTAIGPALLFLLVNAVLLGRELTDMAWLRHREPGELGTPVSSLTRLLLGGAIAGLMLVPFLNLLAPVIGAAAGTHVTHRALQRRATNA